MVALHLQDILFEVGSCRTLQSKALISAFVAVTNVWEVLDGNKAVRPCVDWAQIIINDANGVKNQRIELQIGCS